MSGDYRDFIDAKPKGVAGSQSRNLAELWDTYINEERAVTWSQQRRVTALDP